MPEPKRWSIKIIEDKAIVYKNEKPHLENTDSYIIQVEEMIYGEKTAIKVILI